MTEGFSLEHLDVVRCNLFGVSNIPAHIGGRRINHVGFQVIY